MSKAEIVERLLENKHITAKEAVILLKSERTNIPMYTPNHYYSEPNWTGPPPIYCGDEDKYGKGTD